MDETFLSSQVVSGELCRELNILLVLSPELASKWQDKDYFAAIMSLEGEVFRTQPGRRTLRFEHGDNSYFVKIHFGMGWKEIFRHFLQLRLPVVGAEDEWRAIQFLERLGVDTMRIVGYGRKGLNPVRLQSFIVTEELRPTNSLEELTQQWLITPPTVNLKRAIIDKVASIARRIHENGLNHRDFYLCHFLVDLTPGVAGLTKENLIIYLIDLHRAQIRKKIPKRWLAKDIGSLYFSSMHISLSQRDFFRFMMKYRNKPLRQILQTEKKIWQSVQRRCGRLLRRGSKKISSNA